jgi:hypothetical protein
MKRLSLMICVIGLMLSGAGYGSVERAAWSVQRGANRKKLDAKRYPLNADEGYAEVESSPNS